METCIALLRGINVSGHKMIKMEELKQALEELNLVAVRTYIQSGNVVFNCENADPQKLPDDIAGKISQRFGFVVPVVIRTMEELVHILHHNPLLPEGTGDVEKMHVTFLSGIPSPVAIDKLRDHDFSPDKFVLKGKELYLYCPDGYGRTKLTNTFFESKLKVTATTRNWKTVEKLVSMANDK